MRKLAVFAILALCALPIAAQDVKGSILKHLKTSRDFSLKVAEAMPAESYDFKMTPAQMSFGGQMTHLAQGTEFFLSAFSGEKPGAGKPASASKADVMAFMKTCFDKAVAKVETLTDKQLAASYKTEEGSMTGIDLLMGLLDHTTHHRASAEMYLRTKGITPPEYQF